VLSARDFELLLPWYLNGTLSDSERCLVTAYLAAHPEEAARAQWNVSLRGAIKSQAEELPSDLGLARALQLMQPGRSDEGPGVESKSQPWPGVEVEAHEVLDDFSQATPSAGASPDQFTQLLQRSRAGDRVARDALFALAYADLKKLAHARLFQGGSGKAPDTTALVHETYIRFIESGELHAEDRRSFFAFASQVMRNVIVDTARARLAQRPGGGAAKLTMPTELLSPLSGGEEAILDVHEALLVLEQADPRLAQVVEMRYYGGYTEAEIAETLGITERTVQRVWNKARLLLKAALQSKG
jgi:RNA polymerase sigma factor (TIGR02999 family)